MKILIVGSAYEAAMEHAYIQYLTEMGVTNELFPAQNFFYDYYHSSFLNKIKFRLGISNVFKSINLRLIEKATHSKPDLLLVFKGMEIFPDTLKKLKQLGLKLVNYNPDSPFIFSGFGSGNKNITDSVELYDLYITYDREVLQQLKQRGVNGTLIPFGFEISNEQFAICAREQEIVRLCFLGNPDKSRAGFINQLAEAGLPIDVYGHHWHRYGLHKAIQIVGPAYGLEFWKVLRKYRVQLNLMRPHNPDSHNMRSIEVPGVGGIGLFPETTDHCSFFQDGREIFLYTDAQDCIEQAKHLLSLHVDQANEIRERARARSIHSGYTYKDRTRKMVEYLQQLL